MSDPHIEKFKNSLKQLGIAVKFAHKTKEGKKMPSDYWTDIIKMLKKAKLGISMMELGIDDESAISITHDKTKDSESSQSPSQQQDSEEESDSTPTDTKSKLASIGLKAESKINIKDIMNHLYILLSEMFDKVLREETEFVVCTNNRKFTIKFDDKFYMITEDYNFELGSNSDLQLIVNNFSKLSSISHNNLVKEYNQQVV